MVDDSLYISTYEAALAVVATSMKKARLTVDMLILNSFMGGLLFASGGMLHAALQANCPELYKANPGIIEFLQGFFFPIGLFYVVVLGADLFNSNVLYFGVGVLRGAVSIFDVVISWTVSYAFNVVGNIFVCYVIVWFLHVGKEPSYKEACIAITMKKALFSFVETMIKSMAGNFFVCLGVYLQIMAKPLHVKFIMITVPVFTFSAVGFSHAIADMFLLIMGLVCSAPISVGKVVWKVMLPEAIGNIIGGVFFAITIPWYSHLVSVEHDQKKLRLPRFTLRDEQPELNTDSRVIRQKEPDPEEDDEDVTDLALEKHNSEILRHNSSHRSSASSMVGYSPAPFYNESVARTRSRLSRTNTNVSVGSRGPHARSPRNVFPVYGMGKPLERETSIASGVRPNEEDEDRLSESIRSFHDSDDNVPAADYIGLQIKRLVSRKSTRTVDEEQAVSRRPSFALIRQNFARRSSNARRASTSSQRINKANLSPISLDVADATAGTSSAIQEEESPKD